MRTRLVLPCALLAALGLAAACADDKYYAPDPQRTFDVVASMEADGVTYANGSDAGLPADSYALRLHADVTAPVGSWSLTLSSGGGIALAGAGTAGVVTIPIYADGDGGAVGVDVGATLTQPAGSGFIHASLGPLSRDFTFAISPVVPSLDLCPADSDGACGDAGAADASPSAYVDDAGVEWLPSPTPDLSPGAIHDGDRVWMRVSLGDGAASAEAGPSAPGRTWAGTLTTSGVLWIAGDAGPTRSEPFVLDFGSGPVFVPATIVGEGTGGAFASVASGPQASRFVQAGSASAWPHRVQLVGYEGVAARNRVTVCSSRTQGNLRVVGEIDAGTVVPSDAVLSVVPGGPCAEPYAGEADFVWTGYDPTPVWTLVDDTSDASSPVVVPMLGTGVTVSFASPSIVLLADGGAGAPDAGTGQALVQVSGMIVRNTAASDAGVDAVGGSSVAIATPVGVTAVPATLTSDSAGKVSFQLLVPPQLSSFPVMLTVDNHATTSVPIHL